MSIRIGKLQVARRCVQFSVLALVLLIPAVARYNNYLAARELDRYLERWEGTLQGETLASIDAVFRFLPGGKKERAGSMSRNREVVLAYAQSFRGGPWSAEILGLSLTDPLAGAESIAAGKRILSVLVIGLLVPVLGTIVLGRVFCSWICPAGLFFEMTDKVRRALRFLEIPPGSARFSTGTKYALLAAGLLLTAVLAIPVLSYIYPPAVVGRELHDLVFGVFDRAEGGETGFWLGGLTWMSIFLVAVAAFEVFVSRRWWCRCLCPGGALYSLLGAKRLVRVKRKAGKCTHCGVCAKVCPMGLAPVQDRMGIECDNCGVCISHCEDDALDYGITRYGRRPGAASRIPRSPALFLLLCLLLFSSPAAGHHILGIPHYAYDEDYPQAPVLTYRVEEGPYDVRMTGYPGVPAPGEQCSMYVYIKKNESGEPFCGGVALSVFRDRMFAEDTVVYGPVTASLEENVYKFYPRFEDEANYTVRIEYEVEGTPWIVDLPMVVGEPGSPWAVVGGVGVGVVLFLIAIRAVRIKLARRAPSDEPESVEAPDLPEGEGAEA